jgi:hypothetical protein
MDTNFFKTLEFKGLEMPFATEKESNDDQSGEKKSIKNFEKQYLKFGIWPELSL